MSDYDIGLEIDTATDKVLTNRNPEYRPIVDGKCEPCGEPLVWDGSACSCPGETVFVSSRNTCEACPSGATYANGTCDCGAKFYYGSSNTCSKIEKPTDATNPT